MVAVLSNHRPRRRGCGRPATGLRSTPTAATGALVTVRHAVLRAARWLVQIDHRPWPRPRSVVASAAARRRGLAGAGEAAPGAHQLVADRHRHLLPTAAARARVSGSAGVRPSWRTPAVAELIDDLVDINTFQRRTTRATFRERLVGVGRAAAAEFRAGRLTKEPLSDPRPTPLPPERTGSVWPASPRWARIRTHGRARPPKPAGRRSSSRRTAAAATPIAETRTR